MKEKLWYLTWQAWEQWWWNNFANATHHVSSFGSYYRFYNDILGLVGIANIAHWFSGLWVTSYSQCPTHSSASALGLTFGCPENRCRRKSVYSKSDLCVVINFGKVDLCFSLGFMFGCNRVSQKSHTDHHQNPRAWCFYLLMGRKNTSVSLVASANLT